VEAVDQFLRSRQINGCSRRTVEVYSDNLRRFEKVAPPDLEACSYAIIAEYLANLQRIMKPVSVHQHYRSLRTFFRSCVNVAFLHRDPMAGLSMKVPKALPKVPEVEDVKRLLDACATRRDKALVALLVKMPGSSPGSGMKSSGRTAGYRKALGVAAGAKLNEGYSSGLGILIWK